MISGKRAWIWAALLTLVLAVLGVLVLGYRRALLANSSSIEQLAGSLESLATTLGLVVGGVWTYRLFVKNRLRYPRARVSHAVTVLPAGVGKLLVHVDVTVENTSDVLISLVSGEVRVLGLQPMSRELLALTENGKDPVPEGDIEVQWPKLDRRPFDWSAEAREIEPKESDTYQFDFVIDGSSEVFQVYSYIRNHVKHRREIGWNTTTTHRRTD